ncbi:GNAT acetyltransferase [Marininema mesophilum]|uniref:GNAT acetyltransferase n=1 Tax=Marininema mesophilum TaxID=1048340 RepID=A0A1H2QA34_9BACL|nr:GNAT family N-acetyltransferase [Marininema mesophilum]SDW04016.1 GNAT acetyltransferase [Marininema mesophilum]
MIYPLARESVVPEQIQPLFHEHLRHPILNGILAGHNKGRIYVDHPRHPACALIWAEQEIFYLLGEPKAAFVDTLPTFIKEVIAPEAMRIDDPFFQVELLPGASDSLKWQSIIEEELYEFIPKSYDRVMFTFSQERYRKLPPLSIPPGVRVEPITFESLAKDELKEVREMITDFWVTSDAFLKKGFGYVVLLGDEVVCCCLTAFATETDVEIGIHTYSRAHRGKGYGEIVTRAFLDKCLAEGRVPHWKTEDFRLPSLKLAEKVGFINRQEYRAYVFLYNELDNFLFTAYHRLRYRGNFVEAEHYLEQAIRLGKLKGWHHFLLACGYSLAKDIEKSLFHMKQAVELGWKNVSDIRYDLDLVNLRKTKRGRLLLEEFERRLG